MRKIVMLNIFFVLLIGCSSPNLLVGGGQSPDMEAPKLTLSSPANFSFVPSTFSITGNATDNVGVSEVVIIIYRDGNEVGSRKASISKDTSFICTIDMTEIMEESDVSISGEYSIVVNAYDAARNTSSTSSKSISITVDAGDADVNVRSPSLFQGELETVFNSKKFQVYSDLDYFQNKQFEISGTVEDEYGVTALTLQLEFAGSSSGESKSEESEFEESFEKSEKESIVWEYRIFRKDGAYYYNTADGKEELAAGLFSGSLNNFRFKIDSDQILIDGAPLNYNVKYYFKVTVTAEKKNAEFSACNAGYVCIYPKSDEPWVVPLFVDGTSFSVGSSIFGEAYDDDGISEQGVFYYIAGKDDPQPELEKFKKIGNGTNSKNVLAWKIDLSKEISQHGNYKLWYYAEDINGVFQKEKKDSLEPIVNSLGFIVPDLGRPISEVEMFQGKVTDETKKVSTYPADSNGDFLLAGSAYDTSEVQAVIFAWVPKGRTVPDLKETDWSDYIDESYGSGKFFNGVKYWRIPLGTPKDTDDERKQYDIKLQLNDRTDFKLEDGTVEYDNKSFYIFTKGADDANGTKKFDTVNYTVPKDLMPPEVSIVTPESDKTEGQTAMPVTFEIKASDNESIVNAVHIYTEGMAAAKQAVLQNDGSWEVDVGSFDFSGEVNGTKKFIVTATDLYGNTKQSIRQLYISSKSISISQVTSEISNTTMSNGQVKIEVIADDEMTVDITEGKPRLKLNVTNPDKKEVYADYESCSVQDKKTNLYFIYEISQGDAASPLNVEALELNGATIQNEGKNTISGTIPVIGVNSLRSRNITIDTSAPQILSVAVSVPKGAYGAKSKIDIKIGFDRGLKTESNGSCTLTLNTKSGGYKVSFSSSVITLNGNTAVFPYEVSDGENADVLDVITFENNGLIADENGNKPTTIDCSGRLAKFREITIDTEAPYIVSYSINGKEKSSTEETVDTPVDAEIEIIFNEEVMKSRGSILLERVYKSYPAVMTNEEKANYESIRSFDFKNYYVNRCIGTVVDEKGNIGPDREGKWVLKYEYDHGAYDKAPAGDVEALWNYFADVGAASDKCLDYNTVRVDIQSGLVTVDGRKVSIILAEKLPKGITFSIKVKGVFTDKANNESVDSDTPVCRFETVGAADPVIRIDKVSGLENRRTSQPTSTYFKISSETYGATYKYGYISTADSGNIPKDVPSVSMSYSSQVWIGEGNYSAYIYRIHAQATNTRNKSSMTSDITKELAFKTVLKINLPGATHVRGSDSTGGPASTTEFPMTWYTNEDSAKISDGYYVSWHILKQFQWKAYAHGRKDDEGKDLNGWEADPNNTIEAGASDTSKSNF
ncbi:MAG: hypothetical protein J1G30_07765 [Spirochaetales bacterium]|nr:hypothetical protein [Spirochaetales bacterium]